MDNIQGLVYNAICEQPKYFEIEGKKFCIYPHTLGKLFMIDIIKDRLNINEANFEKEPLAELFLACCNHREDVLRIISIATFDKKKDVLDTELIASRIKELDSLQTDEITTLFYAVMADDNIKDFVKHYGINMDEDNINEIKRVKSENNTSVTLGGRSIYGALIDVVCQRYGWTFEYVVWGISYCNLIMLVRDRHEVVYLSKEERKKARLKTGEVLSGDSRENIQKVKKLFKE